MINLTWEILKDPEITLSKKLIALKLPLVYCAENLKDYNENKSTLRFPLYKRILFFNKDPAISAILFRNLQIHETEQKLPNHTRLKLSDSMGEAYIYWDNNLDLSFHSGETVPAIIGLYQIKQRVLLGGLIIREIPPKGKKKRTTIPQVRNLPLPVLGY